MFWQLLPSVTLHVILCLIYTCIWYSPQKDFWNSYRKLAWMGFEPMTTEFRSDTLTNWAIRPWVQLALRANFVQLLQFHRLFSVPFHFGYCLHQSPRSFSSNFCWGNHMISPSWYKDNIYKATIYCILIWYYQKNKSKN